MPSPDSTSVSTPDQVADVLTIFGEYPRRGTERHDAIKKRGRHLAVAQDKSLGAQSIDRDGFTRQGMIPGQHDDDRIAVEKLGPQGTVKRRFKGPRKGDVDLALVNASICSGVRIS